MPGNLITADWQMQLDTWTGGGSLDDWRNVPPGWSDPTGGPVVGQTVDRAFSAGAAAGFDTDGSIVFTASLSTAEALLTPADAMDALVDLRSAWRAYGRTEKELWMQLPGIGLCYLVGRPRAPEVSLALVGEGVVTAMVTFIATDGELIGGS